MSKKLILEAMRRIMALQKEAATQSEGFAAAKVYQAAANLDLRASILMESISEMRKTIMERGQSFTIQDWDFVNGVSRPKPKKKVPANHTYC